MNHRTLAFALGLALLPTFAVAQPAKQAKTLAGETLQTKAGMTLYVYDGDEVSQGQRGSACTGPCASLWTPFHANKSDKPTGDWNIITRSDGTRQWTYKGRPLYTFSRDRTPGETAGNGFEGNTWHIAKP